MIQLPPELLNNTTANVLHKLLESSDDESNKKVVRRAMRSFNKKTAEPSNETENPTSKNIILPQLYTFDESGNPAMVDPNAAMLIWNGTSYSIGSWEK